MLNISVVPHREFLAADASEQKLFMMLKLKPTQEVANTRPSTTFAFLIDTSGSMYEIVTGNPVRTGKTIKMDGKEYDQVNGGKAKIDVVIESLEGLVRSGRLGSSDRVAVIQFDDRASTIIPLTPGNQSRALEEAIGKLRNYSGGTRMGLGMKEALKVLDNQEMSSRRALIFTDGATFDDDQCREIAQKFATNNIPITALGVGDYNEDLLIHLSDATAGRLFHVEANNTNPSAVSIDDLPNKIIEEFAQAQQDVITNLGLSVKTVQGVTLTRILRVYPEQAEFPFTAEPYPLGNIAGSDETVFILEFTVANRPAGRVRIAQFGLTYDVPGKNRRGELPPQNVVVQFMTGQIATQVDQEVMGYMQQCNVVKLVDEATRIADKDPAKAEEMLEKAQQMAGRAGNETLKDSLGNAKDELRKTKKISDSLRKTVKMGAKGKTVRMNSNDINEGLSDEEIRRASGT